MSLPVSLQQGDTAPSIRAEIRDADSSIPDLTGATITAHWWEEDGLVHGETYCVLTNPATAEVTFDLADASDDLVPGIYRMRFYADVENGIIFPHDGWITFQLLPGLAGAG